MDSGSDDALRDKWVRILREDGFDVNETVGAVRLSRAGAQLTEHAPSALPDPQSIQDHLRRLGDSVGIDHGAEEVPRWVRPRHARLVVGAA